MAVPQFIGRYEILGSIGSGGMGTLLRARDPKIGGRTVAIKLLKEGIDNDEIRRRFMQEANAAGVLEHENIVRIFDVGEQDGEPFIAMEFIDGETLSQWIRRREPASVVRKLKLIEELCDGLAYAHSFNIVHRDVKPANLMVEKRRGRLKILDFGIAKLADSGITNAGALIGSFNYMSPEQVRGLSIDHRSDIFSVGAVMFELLSYKQAFPGGLGDGVLGRIAEQPAPRLRQVLPDADTEVEQIIGRALEKDPGRRYPDLPAMHRDLARVRRRLDHESSGEIHIDRPDGGPRSGPTPVPTPKPPAGPQDERRRQLRAQQVAQHLDAAMKAFDAGRFEEAIEFTENASAVDETDPRPHELRTRAEAAIADRRAQEYLSQARAALTRGELDDADSFAGRANDARPGHAGVGEMREAIARARNQVALAGALQRARAALQNQEWSHAIRLGAEADIFEPGHAEARSIRQRAQAAIDEAAARERERQERERQRQIRVKEAIDHARSAIFHGRFDEARAHVDHAAQDGADAKTLDHVRGEIKAAERAAESQARRSAQALELFDEASAKFRAGEFRAAIVRCDAALRIVPDDVQILELRRRAQHAAEEEDERRRRAEEAERKRQADEAARQAKEAHDRAAYAELQEARREFDAGHFEAAIARLDRFAPAHPVVTGGADELRGELAGIRAREQREREEAATRAAEEQRLARAARAVALATTARELAAAERFDEALATLGEAARLDPGSVEIQELTRQVREAREAREVHVRHARELAAKLAEAESRLVAGDLPKARKRAEEAAHLDANAPEVKDLLDRLAAAERAAEEKRVAARKAVEAEQLAKERDRKVDALIAKARKARRPADALGFLQEAQGLDPQRAELAALIAERQAEIARAVPPVPAARPAAGQAAATAPVPTGERKAGISPAIIGAAAMVVLLLLGGVWYATKKPPVEPPPKPPIEEPENPNGNQARAVPLLPVSIDALPWARVTISPVGGGEPRDCTTPCQLELPAGDYTFDFENGGLSGPLSQRISVVPGQPLVVRREMPGFDVDRAVSSIVGPAR